MLHRAEIVPTFRACLLGNLRLAILEMHVPDTCGETAEPAQDVRTIAAACAVEVVTGVEHQSNQVRVGQVKETGDFSGRLDIPGAMMMENRREPGHVTHSASNALGPLTEDPPLRQSHPHPPT